mmetsp:Transcript_49667/g.138571  ORF Transcript_49667/g.138571 Transcript_49667/m.138571 type:complete len:209 (-) Transcript_49667:108-734(-)
MHSKRRQFNWLVGRASESADLLKQQLGITNTPLVWRVWHLPQVMCDRDFWATRESKQQLRVQTHVIQSRSQHLRWPVGVHHLCTPLREDVIANPRGNPTSSADSLRHLRPRYPRRVQHRHPHERIIRGLLRAPAVNDELDVVHRDRCLRDVCAQDDFANTRRRPLEDLPLLLEADLAVQWEDPEAARVAEHRVLAEAPLQAVDVVPAW